MILLLLITFINLLIAFANEISAPIKAYFLRPSTIETRIIHEIGTLRKDLSNISLRDNYIEHVKVERKISTLEKQLSDVKIKSSGKKLFINYGVAWGSRLFLSIILIIVSIIYRYTPVLVFDDKFNFSPFGGIINFPTGIDGAISVPFWIFVSNFTCRTFVGLIKK